MDTPVCPRCLGFIPNNEKPGAYCGAISRVDNKTEICSKCGENEAMEDLFNTLTLIRDWPVKEVYESFVS